MNSEMNNQGVSNMDDTEKIKRCALHSSQLTMSLGYTHNGSSYSTFSPPCNGCNIGKEERAKGIWMSGFDSDVTDVIAEPTLGPVATWDTEGTGRWEDSGHHRASLAMQAAGGGLVPVNTLGNGVPIGTPVSSPKHEGAPPAEEEEAIEHTTATPKVEDCDLHCRRTFPDGGAMLCHTANSRGYSLYSPPCNGCPVGKAERAKGLWMN